MTTIKLVPGAVISDCKRYRYVLVRDPVAEVRQPPVVFCMLNPSTADGKSNDATIRRLLGSSAAWHAQGIVVVNLYAYRSTDPRALRAADDPIGPKNNEWLQAAARVSGRVICAWGKPDDKRVRDRARDVAKLLRYCGAELLCLELCDNGITPKHPVRLRADLQPIPLPVRL
jgi:hypothetical protein